MFDLSWGKLIIIGAVALIVIGPKELPGVLRMAGQWIGKMRRMATEFQGQFQEAMREAEMADLKKQFDDTAASFTSALDPSGIKADMEKMINDPLGETPKPADSASASEPGKAADPVAPGAAPVAPASSAEVAAAPAADLNVPLPDLPPPVTEADFATKTEVASAEQPPATPAPAAEGGKAA